MYYKVFDSESCFPEPVTLVGTFTSSGATVTTNIVSGLKVGDYLYSETNNEVRLIKYIVNPLMFTLESAFTANVENEIVKVSDSSIAYTKATIFNFEDESGLFNGYEFPRQSVIEIDRGVIVFTISGVGTKISILAT